MTRLKGNIQSRNANTSVLFDERHKSWISHPLESQDSSQRVSLRDKKKQSIQTPSRQEKIHSSNARETYFRSRHKESDRLAPVAAAAKHFSPALRKRILRARARFIWWFSLRVPGGSGLKADPPGAIMPRRHRGDNVTTRRFSLSARFSIHSRLHIFLPCSRCF